MHPGKVLCNRCGLYERTHQEDYPHDPAQLRSKPYKSNSSISNQLSIPIHSISKSFRRGHRRRPRPLSHGSLLNIHGSAPSSAAPSPITTTTNSPADRNNNSAHSLGALLHHGGNQPDSQSHSPGHNSMRLPSSSPASKSSHLSPSAYPSPHPNSPRRRLLGISASMT